MNDNELNINWYPGHMEKSRRLMEERLKNIDLVLEVADARLPKCTRNPMLLEMLNNKKLLLLLNKSDRADEEVTKRWLKYYQDNDIEALAISLNDNNPRKLILNKVEEMLKEKREKALKRGIRNKVMRLMVIGIPNVGKSTLINRLSGKNKLKAENRPGVTRSLDKIFLDNNLELVDTPGILWPKFEDQDDAKKLALIGSINDNILDIEALALYGIEYLNNTYTKLFSSLYNIESNNSLEILNKIGEARSCCKDGGEIDLEMSAKTFLWELRNKAEFKVSLEDVE